MKILYYVCYDCWVMQSMEHFEDIPKICMDENYSMLDIGGTVDQPRNTKRHYCVDTDELVASRLRWEAEKRRLLENVPFAELPKQIKMNGIPGHLEPLSAWLSREVPNPPPREKVPMGPGKCGKRCHYCSGDKRAYSFVNCTNNSNSPTSQNGISTINVTALAIEQEVEAQQHKIETPQSAEILRTKNPSPDAEMADLTKTLQDRVIVTSPSNATPQQESPNESASDELEPMQVDSPLEDIFEQATISTAISSSNQVAPLELPQTMTRSSPDSAITITDSSDLSEESQDGMKLISASYTALELCTKAEEKKTPVLSSNGAQLAETSNGAVGATSQTQASTSDVTPTLENVTPMSHATFSAVLTPTPTSSSKPNKLNLAANFAEFKERHKKKLDELKKIQEPSTETSTLQASSNEECKPIEENGPKVTENRNESAQEKVEVSKQRSEVKQASVSSRVLKATAKDSAKNPSINLPTALLNSTSTPTSSSSSILENIIPVEERQDQHTDLLTRDHEMDEHYHEQEDYELEGCFSPPASPIQSSSQCSSLENAATPKVSYSLKQLANVITKEQIVSQKKRLESFSQKKNQEEALENQHESMFASSSKFANPNEALEFKLKQKEVLSEEFYVAEIRNSEEIEVVDLEQEENSRQNNEESQNNTAGISMNIDGVPGVQEIVRASISSKQNATKATTPSNDIVAQEKSAVARAKPTLRQMAKKTIQQPRNTTVKPSKKPANSTPTYSMTLPLNTLEVVNVENPPVGASQPVNPTATTNNTSSSPNKRTKSDSDDDEIVFLKEVVSSKKPKVLYTSYGSSDEIQIIEPESTPNRPLTRFNTRTPRSRSITSQDLTPRNSRCLVITNLYKPASTKDIDFNDLADDFIANCEDYGGIQHLYIDHDFLGGKAFIKCPDVASAKLTAECFDQKVFIDQKMSVKFVPEEEYYLLYPKAKNATKLLVASSI
uniref:RRM domain-containing protein n=1 Tax=Acrobeloides nanus TaxID=290746 RepID=A0A914EKJ0_9BILA